MKQQVPGSGDSDQTLNLGGLQDGPSISQTINDTLGDVFAQNSSKFSVQLQSYADTLNNNFPEVYNYSVSITLLRNIQDTSSARSMATSDEETMQTATDNLQQLTQMG